MRPENWQHLVGVPYVADGRDPETGLDCFGLVLYVLRAEGHLIPDLAASTAEAVASKYFEPVQKPEPGDVVQVLHRGRPHVGIVVAPGRVLHASETAGVVVSPLGARARLRGAYRPREGLRIVADVVRAPDGWVRVRVVEDLFAAGGRQSYIAQADGSTVAAFLPPEWAAAPECVSISRNGLRVPREAWGETEAQSGDEIVIARLPRIGAAVFSALGAVEGGSLIAAGGGLTVLGAVVATAANIVVGIGISFLSQALLGVPRAGRTESDENSPTYNLSGIRNGLRAGAPIPVAYGTVTIGGQVIQQYLDVDEQGRSILYCLLALCQGEIESIAGLGAVDELEGAAIPEALQINGNPARNYSGIRVSTRLGTTDQAPIAGFRDSITAVPYDVTLDDLVPFTHTTSGKIDAFQLNFYWPRGLVNIDDDGGGPQTHGVDFTVEWRPVGASAWVSSGTITIIRSTVSAFSSKWRKDGLARDRYEIRVTRTHPAWPETNALYLSDMQLNSVNEILTDDLAYPDLALVGWRAVATNQLSGALPTFTHGNVKAKKVYVWDGVSETAPTFVKQWTDSPSWCAFDVLTNARYGLGSYFGSTSAVLSSVADAATFLAQSVSDGRGGTFARGVCNYVLDSTKKGWDVAIEILTPYRVTPVMVGRRFRFRVEQSVTTFAGVQYSQLFTMGNIKQGSFRLRRGNPDLAANIVEVQYWDEEHNFEPDYETRQNDAALQAGAKPVKATMSLPGVSHRGRAARIAQFRLNVEQADLHAIEFEAALDAVAIEGGDVFAFQHDVVDEHIGGRFSADGMLGAVYLDRDLVVPAPDVRWALVFRSNVGGGDVFQTVYIPAGTYTAGTLIGVTDAIGGVVVMSPAPKKHDVYSCGPATSVLRYYRATDLTLTPKFERKISGVLYDDDIYDDDPGTVATATDQLPNRKRHPAQVTSVVAREVSQKTAEGAYASKAMIAWTTDRDETCDVYIRRADVE